MLMMQSGGSATAILVLTTLASSVAPFVLFNLFTDWCRKLLDPSHATPSQA